MASINDLPSELAIWIVNEFADDRKTLFNLSEVSTYYRRCTEPLRYRIIPAPFKSLQYAKKLQASLGEQPRLAEHTKAITIRSLCFEVGMASTLALFDNLESITFILEHDYARRVLEHPLTLRNNLHRLRKLQDVHILLADKRTPLFETLFACLPPLETLGIHGGARYNWSQSIVGDKYPDFSTRALVKKVRVQRIECHNPPNGVVREVLRMVTGVREFSFTDADVEPSTTRDANRVVSDLVRTVSGLRQTQGRTLQSLVLDITTKDVRKIWKRTPCVPNDFTEFANLRKLMVPSALMFQKRMDRIHPPTFHLPLSLERLIIQNFETFRDRPELWKRDTAWVLKYVRLLNNMRPRTNALRVVECRNLFQPQEVPESTDFCEARWRAAAGIGEGEPMYFDDLMVVVRSEAAEPEERTMLEDVEYRAPDMFVDSIYMDGGEQ